MRVLGVAPRRSVSIDRFSPCLADLPVGDLRTD